MLRDAPRSTLWWRPLGFSRPFVRLGVVKTGCNGVQPLWPPGSGCVLGHMTQHLNRTPHLTPQERVDAWLARFRGRPGRPRHRPRGRQVRHRQLLARPRRVHLEHQDRRGPRRDRRTCSATRLADTDPSGFRTREPPTADGDVTVGVHRVRDRRRPRRRAPAAASDDQAWTLLTDAAGAEGPRGAARARRRVLGAVHGADPDPRSWAEKRADEEADARLRRRSRTSLVIGGGQGGIALGARLRQLGVPDDRRRQARAARRPVAQALQVAVPARPGLVRPPAVPAVPRRTGRCSRRRTRSATGSSSTPGSWRCRTGRRPTCLSASLRRRAPASGPSRSTATARS